MLFNHFKEADAETLNIFEELLTQLESDFIPLMNNIVRKYGQQLSGPLKVSLECAICKEIIIEVNIL